MNCGTKLPLAYSGKEAHVVTKDLVVAKVAMAQVCPHYIFLIYPNPFTGEVSSQLILRLRI